MNPEIKKSVRKKKPREMNTDIYILDNVIHFGLDGRGKGSYAMISADKWPVVGKYSWYLGKAGYPLCYELGKMQLHKLVYQLTAGTRCPTGIYIDHIDRNKLNNTDTNLRLATPQQNSFNKTTTSNIKGVRKISKGNYTATVTKDGKKHEIKNIPTISQAAETYNFMAEELFGEFASYNNIDNIKEI